MQIMTRSITAMQIPSNIGGLLSRLRIDGNVSQTTLAGRIGVDQSRISRMEKGEIMPTPTDVRDYLKALATKEARAFLNYLEKKWTVLQKPSLENPELEAIWHAEQQLQLLDAFEKKRNPPEPVRAEANMHRQTLRQAAEFLARLDHQFAFVGNIGVGKTTALSIAAGLTVRDAPTALQSRVILETGSGKTTIGEVRIRSGNNWGIVVEPYPDLEIYQLVGDLCESLLDRAAPQERAEKKEIPKELERALRNMAGLASTLSKLPDGTRVRRDDAVDLAQSAANVDEFRSVFASKLKLWSRTTRELWCPDSTLDAEQWLRDTFGKVNKGQLTDVSLPKRIDVIVPKPLLDQSLFDLSFIDTRGVAETAIRPDIRAAIDNPRAVVILCSSFNAAPDQTMVRLIEHIVGDIGAERLLSDRLGFLILPRPGEAVQTKDDMGNTVESDEEGYDWKREYIAADLRKFSGDIPIHFFNALSDDVEALATELASLVKRARQRHVERIRAATEAIDQLLRNYRVAKANLVRQDVRNALRIFIDQHLELPDRLNPAHGYIVSILSSHYASTVWATTRRQGTWYNLDVYHGLGVGAAREAKRRCSATFDDLTAIVNNLLGNREYRPAHAFLREVLENSLIWKETFLETVHREAAEIFRPALQDDVNFWTECQERWGRGGGYRNDVGKLFRKWFEEPKREPLHRLLEGKTSQAWAEDVLSPLRALCTES
jgi:transcriptional regulator with XRE-family HTH domain